MKASFVGASQVVDEGQPDDQPIEEKKDSDVLIDFRDEMKSLKKSTEIHSPYIQTVTEDAMFLSKTQIVTLEFTKY